MQNLEHTFQIPETEIKKLDRIRAELPSGSLFGSIGAQRWMTLGVFAVVGALAVHFFRKRG